MGEVEINLGKVKLPERENHHSRLFVDLAENIHIHHREFRTVFSMDEYFEYADIINKSTKDIRNYLIQNPDYKEKEYPTTIVIAGGKERQLKFLKNSPKPNKSTYFSTNFSIELQKAHITDEIHIHYRDFRIALNREHFKIVAEEFDRARKRLIAFERENNYERNSHPDRVISAFNEEKSNEALDTKLMGIKRFELKKIKSAFYKDILIDFKPNSNKIKQLKKLYNLEKRFVPILLSTEKNGDNLIVDGHHRVYSALNLGLDCIDAVVLTLSFKNTEKIRKAEALLKDFDYETNNSYNISNYLKEYLAYKFNRYYENSFHRLMNRNTFLFQTARRVKKMFLMLTGNGSK